MRKKNNPDKIHYLFFICILLLMIPLTWESYTQLRSPELSLLKKIHRSGYLNWVEIVYEPGKGIWHFVGWAGSAAMILMMSYSIRKRFTRMSCLGNLAQWLNIHIILGLIGTVCITFHTTFKFGGIVSLSYWSMLITSASGIIGRYIYIQIPRAISGSELKIEELDALMEKINNNLILYPKVLDLLEDMTKSKYAVSVEDINKPLIISALSMIRGDIKNIKIIWKLKSYLHSRDDLSRTQTQDLLALLRKKVHFHKRINFLSTSHRLFRFWHIFHLPIAIVMFIIMFLHITISYVFHVY